MFSEHLEKENMDFCAVWDKCIPERFYKYVFQPIGLIYLNGQNVLRLKKNSVYKTEIIRLKYVLEDPNNYQDLCNYFGKYWKIYQYIYAFLFPNFYIANQECGIDIHTFFVLNFKERAHNKEQKENARKNANICTELKNVNEFEQ